MESYTPKIIRKTSPYLRRPQASVTRMMRDVVIALLPVTAFAIYRFQLDAVLILVLSILSMTVTEYIYYQVTDIINGEKFKLKNKSFSLYNYSAMTSGLIYGLILPNNTAPFAIIISGALGIFFGKLIFGGLGQNIFNPAGLARVILIVNYAGFVNYEIPGFTVDGVAGATALGELASNAFSSGALEHFALMDLFTGIGIPGSIGEISAILIIAGGIYLALRTSFEVRIPLVFVGTVFLLSGVVAIQQNLGIWYPLYHVFSGGLLFGAVFMATDPITSPITKPGRVYYAFALGVLTFFIRLFGGLPEGVVFAILIMNMFVTTFDYHKWTTSQFTKKQGVYFSIVLIVTIIVTLVGASYVG